MVSFVILVNPKTMGRCEMEIKLVWIGSLSSLFKIQIRFLPSPCPQDKIEWFLSQIKV